MPARLQQAPPSRGRGPVVWPGPLVRGGAGGPEQPGQHPGGPGIDHQSAPPPEGQGVVREGHGQVGQPGDQRGPLGAEGAQETDRPPGAERDAGEDEDLLGQPHRSEQHRADQPGQGQGRRCRSRRPHPRGVPSREELGQGRRPPGEGHELTDLGKPTGEDPAGADQDDQAGGYPCQGPDPPVHPATGRRRRRPVPVRRGRPVAGADILGVLGVLGSLGVLVVLGVVGGGQLIGVGTVEPVLEDPAAIGGQPGAAGDLELADLLVGQAAVALQDLPLAPDHRQATEVPAPGAHHRPGPGPVAGHLGHDDLADRQHQHLGKDPDEVERAVALEDGQQLVAALELLEGDGFRRRPVAVVGAGQQAVDGPRTGGDLLQVPHPGIGGDDDPGSDDLGPPAQVEVLAHGDDGWIEPPELVEQVGPHQRGPAGGDEDVPHGIVLTVVDLVGVDPLHHRTGLVHGHAHVDQALGVVPADHLGRHHPGVGPERLFDQQVDGVREQGDVVVAQQVVGRPVDHGAHLVDGGAEATVLLEPTHVGGGEDGGHPRGYVLGTGRIQHQDRELRIVLRGQRGQRLFEPRTGIVGDDDGDDRRGQCVHQGSEAIGLEVE